MTGRGALDSAAGAEVDGESERQHQLLDQFSDFISEAKQFRELAVSGALSDEQRRSQAAAMAMRLAQMIDLDEDDEDE